MEAKKSLKVLNIGNSFSNSLKVFFPDVVASAGCELQLEAASHGGCELHRHWKYITDEENDGVYSMYQDRRFKLREILAREQWDIVSIQQASHYSWRPETYQPYASNIVEYVRKYAPSAEIVIQQTWAYRADDSRIRPGGAWGIDQAEMYRRLTDAYLALSKELGLRVIPTGKAVQLARQREAKPFVPYAPEVIGSLRWPDLPSQAGDVVGAMRWAKDAETGRMKIYGDTIHLNTRGQFLQACVWFAFLFNRKTSEITLRPDSLGDDDIESFKAIAQEAVDSAI
jgi:hypothetical protein